MLPIYPDHLVQLVQRDPQELLVYQEALQAHQVPLAHRDQHRDLLEFKEYLAHQAQ